MAQVACQMSSGGTSDVQWWPVNRHQKRVLKGGREIGVMNLHEILMKFETVTALLVISDEGTDQGH